MLDFVLEFVLGWKHCLVGPVDSAVGVVGVVAVAAVAAVEPGTVFAEVLAVVLTSVHTTEVSAVQDSFPSFHFLQQQHSWHFEPNPVSVVELGGLEPALTNGLESWS